MQCCWIAGLRLLCSCYWRAMFCFVLACCLRFFCFLLRMSDRPPEKDFIKVRQCLTCSTHSPRCPNCFRCVTSRVIHCICDVTPPKGLPYKEALVLFSSSNQATPSDPSVLADFSSPSSVPDHSLWNPCACENRSHCARCGKCRRAAGCCTCSSPLPPMTFLSLSSFALQMVCLPRLFQFLYHRHLLRFLLLHHHHLHCRSYQRRRHLLFLPL